MVLGNPWRGTIVSRYPAANRNRSARNRARRQVVLVFGEDENDTRAIAELIVAACPELIGKVKPRARPPVLIKDARPEHVPSRAATIAAIIDVERVSADVVCVFAHEDCDALEPAHEDVTRRIEDALAAQGHRVHAVAPAWEMEAWWFQWPAAVASYRPSWKRLPDTHRNFGQVQDAKEQLTRALRPTARGSKKTRDYSVTDAPAIARKVRELGIVRTPIGRSDSFNAFLSSVESCCGSLA